MLQPNQMSPVEQALWLKSELDLESLVDTLREYHDDLTLPELRQLAQFWMRVWPVWFGEQQKAVQS